MADFMSAASLQLMGRHASRPTDFELGGRRLLSCPFCGLSDQELVSSASGCHCHCRICGADGPRRRRRVDAVQQWQQRRGR